MRPQEKKIFMEVKGVRKPYFVRVWNPTVANLTLMALGSSAPEVRATAPVMPLVTAPCNDGTCDDGTNNGTCDGA